MASVNQWHGIGNLGKDPEVRFLDGGQQLCNFSLACNEQWTDKQGQKQQRTEWVRIVAWGKLADICGKYLAKGRQCYVEGKLQTRKWTDKEGTERYTTQVVAQQVVFLGSKSDGQGQSQGQGNRSNGAQQSGQDAYDYGPPPMDDDIPF